MYIFFILLIYRCLDVRWPVKCLIAGSHEHISADVKAAKRLSFSQLAINFRRDSCDLLLAVQDVHLKYWVFRLSGP